MPSRLLPVDVNAISAVNMHGVSNDSGNDWTVASLRKNPLAHKRALMKNWMEIPLFKLKNW